MDNDVERIRRAAPKAAGRRDRHGGGAFGPQTDLAGEAGNRLAVPGRIEQVLDAAKANGHPNGENPARWRGHLDKLLPKRQKLTRGHHAAMAYADVPAFIAGCASGRRCVAARALEFCDPDGGAFRRSARRALGEIDEAEKVWTVPADAHESGARASRPAFRASARRRSREARRRVPAISFFRVSGRAAAFRHGDGNAVLGAWGPTT